MQMATPDAAVASLDEQFHKTVTAIEKRLQLLGRLPQVRIKAWLAKMKLSTSNVTWKRNRNLYATLLLEQLRAGCLEVPFNALPPEGSLPTLPTYLTYRFISPPNHQKSLTCCEDYDAVEQPRPASAAGFFKHRSPPGSHTAWTVMRSSAPMQLQQVSPNAAGVAANLAGYPVLSPIRCGSPPRKGYLPGQQQQQQQLFCSPSSRGRCNVGAQALHPLGSGEQAAAHSSGHLVLPGHGVQQRPTSPAAAGLLDAAAALAAEVEAGRGDAAMLESRLRYAEDKLLQQEAELVRLQGQAVASRRRLKAATASTLGDLVERYSSAAAAWHSPGSPNAAGKPPSRQAVYAEAVYGPMWQLISSIQQVLDTCDQQDLQWQQAQSGAAAAAIAKFEADWAAQIQHMYETSLAAEGKTAAAAVSHCDTTQQAADAAAAGEQAVRKQLKETLSKLLQHAEQVVAAMAASKNAATAAAGGGQVTAAEVAAGAADALKALMKVAKQATGKDRKQMQKHVEAAGDAAAAVIARADKRRSSSDSSSDGESSSSSSSDNSSEGDAEGSAMSCQLQQQCRAHIARLQAMHKLLLNLDNNTNKVVAQLSDGQKRLLDIASNSSPVSTSVLASPDRGLAAAATAGITASLAADMSSYVTGIKEIKQQLKALSKAAALGDGINGGGADAWQTSMTRATSAAVRSQNDSKQSPIMSRASSAALQSQDLGQQRPSLSRASSAAVRFEIREPSFGPRQSDVTLAGSIGSGAVSSPRLSLLTPPAGAADAGGRGSSIAQLLSGGPSSGGPPAGSSLFSKAPLSPRLLTQPQQPGSSLGGSSTSPSGGAEAVHQRLASLSHQASRISERASQILGTSNSVNSGRSSPDPPLSGARLTGRLGAASPSLLQSSLLSGGLTAGGGAALRSPSLVSGSGLLLGKGLTGSSVTASAGRLTGHSMLSAPVSNLGRAGSLPGGGVASVLRPSSASPRLSGLASSGVTTGLLASGGRPGGLNSSSLAALSNRLSNLGIMSFSAVSPDSTTLTPTGSQDRHKLLQQLEQAQLQASMLLEQLQAAKTP